MTIYNKCVCIGCNLGTVTEDNLYCFRHQCALTRPGKRLDVNRADSPLLKMSEKYPKYYKDVSGVEEIDTYHINKLFPVDDDTGCILHARKKLLIPGSRTGGKSMKDDIIEARDTLNRWLDLIEQE